MKKISVKIVEYKLANGADEKPFLNASAALMSGLAKLRGFIKRELHRGENGRWRDVVYWKAREDADKSDREIPNLPACVRGIAMMDHFDMTVTHFRLAQEVKID